MIKNSVIVECIFNGNKNLVWRAITEKELMKLCYFNLKEFDPVVGFKFEFTGGPDDGIQYIHLCEITEVISGKKLTYSWKYEGYEGISFVSFELFDENENTRLLLTHTGIDSFPANIPDFAIHNFEEGWNQIINSSLKNFIENNNA